MADNGPHCTTCTCGCTCGYGGFHEPLNLDCDLNAGDRMPNYQQPTP